MIKNRQLLLASSALKYGSFKKAAAIHNISVPAFSRSISGLEASLGVTLFNRTPTGVTPTIFGTVLAKHSQKILDATLELEREISLLKQHRIGELSIAFGPYPAEISGHAALAKLISKYPEIRCKTTVHDWHGVEKQILRRQAEIGLAEVSVAVDNKQLQIESPYQHQFVFLLSTGPPDTRQTRYWKRRFSGLSTRAHQVTEPTQ